jgi:putative membrane protein
MEITSFMLSMCTTQIFIEFIPAVFIGAPSENTFESILPAHRMLLEGKAIEAICLSTTGALIAIIVGSLLTPLFFLFIKQNSKEIILVTPLVLIFALIVFVISEKTPKRMLLVFFVIIAASSQGILFENQIFPLITGYFGVAGILYSLKEKEILVKQQENVTISFSVIKESLIGVIGGSIVSIMPGIGSNTAAGIINTFRNKKSTNEYLAMLGAINASNFFFSYSTLFALSKARNGGMLALQNKIFFTQETFFIGTIIMIFAAGIGGLVAIILSKKAIKIFTQSFTQKISIWALVFVILLVFALNGFIGLSALLFSTALGLFVLTNNLRRSICISSLIVPVLFFYLFILI